ncbi:hypothetical protein B296_00042298 [Ensete ventricosum]|uniref:Uncharacterized protein n=1 Tax=Ensete ventricosum TaxID=4639 RepID=A0A426XYI5_ENSVE|nr:hypothetical protein B296_00042298 [Ensete ventricosum]
MYSHSRRLGRRPAVRVCFGLAATMDGLGKVEAGFHAKKMCVLFFLAGLTGTGEEFVASTSSSHRADTDEARVRHASLVLFCLPPPQKSCLVWPLVPSHRPRETTHRRRRQRRLEAAVGELRHQDSSSAHPYVLEAKPKGVGGPLCCRACLNVGPHLQPVSIYPQPMGPKILEPSKANSRKDSILVSRIGGRILLIWEKILAEKERTISLIPPKGNLCPLSSAVNYVAQTKKDGVTYCFILERLVHYH